MSSGLPIPSARTPYHSYSTAKACRRLWPAGHGLADTLARLVPERDGAHPVVVGLVEVDRVLAMAAPRPRFCHASNGPVWLLPEGNRIRASRQTASYLGKLGGRNWVRTSDPSLVRRNRTVAGRRSLSPVMPAKWTNHRRASPYVARRLVPLAPRLAPRISVSSANEWRQSAGGSK